MEIIQETMPALENAWNDKQKQFAWLKFLTTSLFAFPSKYVSKNFIFDCI